MTESVGRRTTPGFTRRLTGWRSAWRAVWLLGIVLPILVLASGLVWPDVSRAEHGPTNAHYRVFLPNSMVRYTPSQNAPATQTPVPEATQTPVSGSSESYHGVIRYGTSTAGMATMLASLGVGHWFEFGGSLGSVPAGRKAELIRVGDSAPVPALTQAQVQAAAQSNRGAHWIIGNEPNVVGQDNLTGTAYAGEFKKFYDWIKAADPTAKLVVGNTLNFNLSDCGGCSYGRGDLWLNEFRQAYRNANGGVEPPVDVWGIHAYPLNWWAQPTVAHGMTDYRLAIEQIKAFRTYLDQNGHAGKPIWVTELGVIWRFEGVDFSSYPYAPTGADRSDLANTYLREMLAWLRSNARSKNIEKWFVYATNPSPEPYATTYTGLQLMNGSESSATLTPAGTIFRESSRQPIP